MHTNEEQSSPHPRYPKGKQVAPNAAQHYNAELFTNESGVMYPVVVLNPSTRLIRGEYHPIGYRFNFPKFWGKKAGVEALLKHNIEQKERIMNEAAAELDKLKSCLDTVQKEWSDSD